MIRPCVCSKKSSSLLEKSKHRESFKSCKSCSGKLPVDELGAQRGSMLSMLGLELSRVIDPHLTWKTASNGRQRAVRRARTSFTGINGKNSLAKRSKESKGLTDKDSKITVDMPVSESEKVGVSILGRRFSETLGSVPIKKRRFQLGHSTSPPHHSSYSDHSDQLFERRPSSYQDTVLNEKQLSPDTNSGSGSEFSHENILVCDRSERDQLNEKVTDAADFSGISILAAVACESNIGCDFLNHEVALSKEHASEFQGVSKGSDNLEKQELLPHTSEEDLAGRTDLPFETSSSSALPSKESNEKSDGSCNPEDSVNSIQTIPSKTMESPSRDVKFHWDLNTVMDMCDGHEEGLYSEQGTINNVSEDGDHNKVAGNMEPYMDQVGFKDTKDGSTDSSVVNIRDHLGGGEQKVMCALEAKIEEKSGIPSDNSASDLKESLPSSENGYGLVQWQTKDSKIVVAGVHEETKFFINKDQSYSVSRDVPYPANNLQDSSLSSASKIEEDKAEASCIILQSKVGSENSSSFVNLCDNKIGCSSCSSKRDCESRLGVDKVPNEAEICVQMKDVTDMRSGTAEEHASSYFDSATAKSKQVTESVISGADTKMKASGDADHYEAVKSREKDFCEYETSALEMTVEYTKNSAPSDDIDVVKKDSSIEISLCIQSPTSQRDVCGKVASDDRLECGYYSDTSQNDANQVSGMEKVELSGDDDSQYEDGEFRESLGNCWLDDGGEEGETEYVDYGTDRDIDACQAGSSLSASVKCHVNNQGLPDANDAHCGDLRGRGDDRSDTGKGWQGHLRTSAGSKNSDFSAGNGNVIGDDGFHKQGGGYRDSIHTANYRMKMSGWDKLPAGGRSSGNGTVNTRIGYRQIHNDAFSDPSRSGGTMKREVGVRRDFSCRTERVQSSDVTRSDKPYFCSTKRNPRVERDGDTRRSFGRSGVPSHLQDRDRGDWWGGSRHDASSNSQHGSKNAAAAAVAKLESNGFVVAPDGTIIKVGTAGSSGHLTRRPSKAHHSPMGRGSPIERERSFGMHPGPICSREMSPDRPLFMGRKAVRYGADHMEGYRGPIHDDIVDSISPPHCPISRRDHSFSPHRRPMNMFRSHSRSPSRSRTRSPHRWMSPKGRITYGMNRGPFLRRRSRSPNFKPEARIGTRTRAGFREPVINYTSLPRNHTSPSHSSRWIDGRKEYEYRQCPGRSPPPRVISRGHRRDFTSSPGRTKPDEYYRPAVLKRLPESVDFDRRRARNGGMADYRREHDERYVNNGNMKRLRYDENGFRAQNLRPKSSEFERRDGRGPLDGGDRQQLGDSPPRSVEGKCHLKSDGDGSNIDNMVDVQGIPL